MDNEEVDNNEIQPNSQETGIQENSGNNGNSLAQKGADQAAKRVGDKLKKDATKKAAVQGKMAAAMGPVIFWATVVIVALIIIIGIIMFFMTMPGMVMEKIKALFKELGNYIAAFFGSDVTTQIDDKSIYETLDYLEEMGYDLKGFGFLTDYYTDKDQSSIPDVVKKKDEDDVKEELKDEGKDNPEYYKFDNDEGVVRDRESGEILLAESDFIFTYIASDNYIYTLKNENIVTVESSWEGFWGFITNLFSALSTFAYKVQNFFFGPINDALGLTDLVQDTWGHGLIALYYEGGGFGKRGYAVNTETLWNHDTIKIDTDNKQLIIAKNELFNTNIPMKYNLDGWTGRYGMPVEFLLSVHVATMMPDLAYNMATGFNTNVNMHLREATGAVNTIFENINGEKVGYEKISDYCGGLIITYEDLYKIIKAGIVPPGHNPPECGCIVTDSDKYPMTVTDILEGIDPDAKFYKSEEDEVPYEVPESERDTTYAYTNDRGERWIIISGESGTTFAEMNPDCEQYVRDVISALQGAYDGNYKTYLPYIADVTKHWYRDVYYVVDLSKDNNFEFVVNDYDYESLMRERWTLYETYTKEEYEEKEGEYKLYILTEDGEYATSSTLPKEAKEAKVKDKVSSDTKYPDYFLYDGTKEEAKEDGLIVSKKAVSIKLKDQEKTSSGNNTGENQELLDLNWQYIDTSNVWSAYKGSSDKYVGDLEKAYPDATDNIKSRVYTQTVLTSGNIQQTGEAQRAETNSKIKRMFLYNTYFRYDGTKDTAEIITAMRKRIKDELGDKGVQYGPLNELYNSSGEKTDVTKNTYTAEELGLKEKMAIVTNPDGTTEEKPKDYEVKEFSGQVTINQDSLNAFSMLENIHTLDADYIYRDFKELVAELVYFAKEELTDEIPKLLAFPIPATGSAGYPDRTIDKRENEYGTMIHSKGDIDENEKLTMAEVLAEMQTGEVPEETEDEGTGTDETTEFDDETPEELELDPEDLGGGLSDYLDTEKVNEMQSVIKNTLTTDLGSYIHVHPQATRTPSQVTLDHYIKACYEMCTYMDEVGYDYCVNRDCVHDIDKGGCGRRGCPKDCPDDCAILPATNPKYKTLYEQHRAEGEENGDYSCCCADFQCDHSVLGNWNLADGRCGLQSNFPATKERSTLPVSNPDDYNRNVYCYLLVIWSLQNVGCLGSNESGIRTAEWGGEIIQRGEKLRPGDILIYHRHVDIYAGISETTGNHIKFNGGHPVSIGATAETGNSAINTITNADENGWNNPTKENGKATHAIRLPWIDAVDGPYEGYNGNEAVVSPVTGILLEYGTYNDKDIDTITNDPYRVNVDLKYGPLYKTEEFESQIISDKVGYAKILVLNSEYYKTLEQNTNSRWNESSGGTSLLTDSNKFRDELVDDEESLAEEKLNGKKNNKSMQWSDYDQTIYAYKEFAEDYEKAGIAGYVVFIDGFICETPDPTIGYGEKASDKIPYENDPTRRKNATYYLNDEDKSKGSISFKSVTMDNFEDEQLDSLYINEDEYKLPSTKATNQLNAENEVKMNASSSIYLPSEDIVYIKEGTAIGRTMTDKELLEYKELRNDPEYTVTYEEARPGTIKEKGKVIGNYIRVIMRDLDKTPVEDVEEYMKLDEVDEINNDILFMAGVITAEAGGKGDGAIACAWVIKNRVESDRFPNTLAEVLVAPGQFTVVNKDPEKCSGWIYQGELISIEVNGTKYYVSKPTDEAIEIATSVYKDGAYPEMNEKLAGRLFWKSKDKGADREGAIQIPPGTGNWFHY